MGRFENLELEIKKKPTPDDIQLNYDEVYYLNLAKNGQINGDFEAALRYFSRALSYKIDIPEAWIGQVLCLIDLGELKEAVTWADRASEVIGNDSELIAVKAMALGRLGDIEKALAYSDQAMKKGKNTPLPWLARGDVIITSDYRNAEFCFKKAIECNPKDPFIYIRIGIAYISVKDYDAGLQYLKRALEINPRSPFVNYLIGYCYQMMGMIDDAKHYYEYALKIRPDYRECIEAYKKVSKYNFFQRLYFWFAGLFRR